VKRQLVIVRADEIVGKTLKYVDEGTVLFVLSDHGFASFERGVNLNAWLYQNGYLVLKEGAEGRDYLQGIDWSRTKAYTFGLAGIYTNQKGREEHGIVSPGAETDALKRELSSMLSGLRDEELGRTAIRKAWPSDALYRGPYLDAAPDLIIGYADGYRASWDAAVGKVTAAVFEDNRKAWSGDHCIDPHLVPGVLLSNCKIEAEDPGIEDMAPTALHLFGVKPPAYMEGKPVTTGAPAPAQREVAA
jgi:predicted AlkP superfamily phosphohydrolase/phosphomutase